MRSCIRRVRVLLPVGAITYGCLARKAQAQEVKDGDSTSPGGQQALVKESLGTQLARQLEAWLLPANKPGSVRAMVEELRDALAEETHMSPEESQRLPMNLLMLKAMHDRELLGAKETTVYDLDRQDRKVLSRAAHFSKYATAAYGIMGNLNRLQEMVIQEASIPPPDLMKERDYLQRWFISKHTGIGLEDVKQVDTSGSIETRAYFVAVDHSTRSVVLSIRGTFSLSDAIVDLLCKSVEFGSGKAHKGISQSAVIVWDTVKYEVEKLLREHDDYQLVLTGHSLGAGTAILLKHLFDQKSNARRPQRTRDPTIGKGYKVELDVDHEVHVECFAFAPPPVFTGKGAANMPSTYSFVHRFDCIPTASLGSLYSLFRTIKNIDRLQLDVYERAAYVLDSRVRVQQREHGVEAGKAKGYRAYRLAINILDLVKTSTTRLTSEGNAQEIEAAAYMAAEISASKERISGLPGKDAEQKGNVEGDEWGTISNIEGDITRFTHDIKEIAENLLDTVDHACKRMDRFYDDVGRVTNDFFKMSSEEIALAALLVQRLAAGGGPSPDKVHSMVLQCRLDGNQPGEDTFHDEITVGDLIIPGKVYWLRGGEIAAAAGLAPGRARHDSDDLGRVRRTSSADLGGIRLCNSMVEDHFMEGYEPALVAAAQRYACDRFSA